MTNKKLLARRYTSKGLPIEHKKWKIKDDSATIEAPKILVTVYYGEWITQASINLPKRLFHIIKEEPNHGHYLWRGER